MPAMQVNKDATSMTM